MIQAFVFSKNKCQCSLRLSDPTLYMACCFIVADVFSLFVRCYSYVKAILHYKYQKYRNNADLLNNLKTKMKYVYQTFSNL